MLAALGLALFGAIVLFEKLLIPGTSRSARRCRARGADRCRARRRAYRRCATVQIVTAETPSTVARSSASA
jgi:hypothetical protein